MSSFDLSGIAKQLVTPGRGILAADESTGTIGKRFASIDVENTEANRRAYREMLFTTNEASEFISGVILYDETIRQSAADGTPFVKMLNDQHIIPGIKVDMGAKDLPFSAGEKVTEGLDGLRERVAEYYKIGARFAKWRAVINIGKDIPSERCLTANAHALARYAALSQEGGLVPIVEPEVIMDGDHTIERCYEVTARALQLTFAELTQQGVALDGILLKPNMILSGSTCNMQADAETVARQTIRCFQEHVPAAVPGIVFLSGGQSDEAATRHLSKMNELHSDLPWRLSFSYGRALQAPALKAWGGQQANVAAARAAYLKRARLNGAATTGRYTVDMEKE